MRRADSHDEVPPRVDDCSIARVERAVDDDEARRAPSLHAVVAPRVMLDSARPDRARPVALIGETVHDAPQVAHAGCGTSIEIGNTATRAGLLRVATAVAATGTKHQQKELRTAGIRPVTLMARWCN